ncbi:MAG: hypothetical protein Q8M54_03375 [Desulfobaccales bacterium]|nr:hypothetical protein [Desulfobaccales bacterium]
MTLRNIHPQSRPAEVLAQIQALFKKLGLFEKKLTLSHQGHKYLASCDSQSFTVYRLIEKCHHPPGEPGWPVCLVTRETIIDETSPPPLPQDEFSSGLTLPDWLQLIEKTFGEG